MPTEIQGREMHTSRGQLVFIKVICLVRYRLSLLHEVIFWMVLIIMSLIDLKWLRFKELLSLQVMLCMRKITQRYGFTNGSIHSGDMIIVPGSNQHAAEQMPY